MTGELEQLRAYLPLFRQTLHHLPDCEVVLLFERCRCCLEALVSAQFSVGLCDGSAKQENGQHTSSGHGRPRGGLHTGSGHTLQYLQDGVALRSGQWLLSLAGGESCDFVFVPQGSDLLLLAADIQSGLLQHLGHTPVELTAGDALRGQGGKQVCLALGLRIHRH